MGRLKQPYTAVDQDLNDMKERFRRAQLKAVRENEAKSELVRKAKEDRRKSKKRKSEVYLNHSSNFTGYTTSGFDESQKIRLKEPFDNLHEGR